MHTEAQCPYCGEMHTVPTLAGAKAWMPCNADSWAVACYTLSIAKSV